MKVLALLACMSCIALPTSAKPRQWKDAVFMGITSGNSGAAAMPVGAMIVAVPLSRRIYWFKSDGITYALTTNYSGHWPNLTVHGHTQISVEGRTAHILDEDKKDRKFSIVEKIAEP